MSCLPEEAHLLALSFAPERLMRIQGTAAHGRIALKVYGFFLHMIAKGVLLLIETVLCYSLSQMN